MSPYLIAMLVILGYVVLAGVTGGLADRMGWGFDVAITLSWLCPVGIWFVIVGIIWRWVSGDKIFK